jgi:hypothetical protein
VIPEEALTNKPSPFYRFLASGACPSGARLNRESGEAPIVEPIRSCPAAVIGNERCPEHWVRKDLGSGIQ